jgi:hypothetical protein
LSEDQLVREIAYRHQVVVIANYVAKAGVRFTTVEMWEKGQIVKIPASRCWEPIEFKGVGKVGVTLKNGIKPSEGFADFFTHIRANRQCIVEVFPTTHRRAS